MGTFQTFQTVARYENALSRHTQWLRWVSGITCPCLSYETGQPDPHCKVCKGRGRIYTSPGKFKLLNEVVAHDGYGRVLPVHTPVVAGSAVVYKGGVPLALASIQPSDRSYVQLAEPYPKPWEILYIEYEYDPDISVLSEDSEVYGPNILRVIAPRFSERGKKFEGSIKSVSRVRNITKSETYTVSAAFKVYIHLDSMGTWVPSDVLEVDYVYQKPYPFMLTGITPKIRYSSAYVLDSSDSILVTPYWAQVSPDDLFTAMAVEQIGKAVLDPSTAPGANDVISAYYDISRLLRVVDRNGKEYSTGPGRDVDVYGRNELKWNIEKPSIPITAQFTYHPTYIALDQMQTLRNSENKAFVNRIGLKQFDRLHDKVEY